MSLYSRYHRLGGRVLACTITALWCRWMACIRLQNVLTITLSACINRTNFRTTECYSLFMSILFGKLQLVDGLFFLGSCYFRSYKFWLPESFAPNLLQILPVPLNFEAPKKLKEATFFVHKLWRPTFFNKIAISCPYISGQHSTCLSFCDHFC